MRKINVTKAAAKPAASKPAAKPAPAKAAAAAKPETKPAPAAKPTETTTPAVAKPIRGLAATARTIVANATHFGGISDRDNAYLTFYSGVAKRNGGTVHLRDLATSEARPAYDGSNKPHDAGVINRLGKAGLLARSADGTSFTFTSAAHTLAAYQAGQR